MPVTSIKAGGFFAATFHGKHTRQHVLSGVDRALAQLGFEAPDGTISADQKALAARERERIDALVGANDARDAWAKAKLACLDATIAGDYAKARACYQEYLPHMATLHLLQAARVPQKGHVLDETNLRSQGNRRTFPKAGQLETLTYGLVNVAEFAATFTQNDKGVIEKANGAIRYGDGYINNAKVTMDKSVDAKISIKTSTGGSTTVDSGVSDKADVSVGSK